MPYSDLDDARDPAALEEAYHEAAADAVQRFAPAPDPMPVPDTYSARAARAEMLIFNYLRQTKGGVLTGKSLSGLGSKSFASDMKAIKSIVKDTMGTYYGGPPAPIVPPHRRRVPVMVNPLDIPWYYPPWYYR